MKKRSCVSILFLSAACLAACSPKSQTKDLERAQLLANQKIIAGLSNSESPETYIRCSSAYGRLLMLESDPKIKESELRMATIFSEKALQMVPKEIFAQKMTDYQKNYFNQSQQDQLKFVQQLVADVKICNTLAAMAVTPALQ